MVAFSLNECYFANKGAALVLGSERGCVDQRRSPARALPQPDIQHHLQSMFYLLRPEETLKMAVKLESAHAGRTRYLVVVSRGQEAALLGIDCNERTSVGLVLRVLADTSIKLDGDGGFSVCVCSQQHIFKPVSVQAMWSALQTLHRSSARARELNHFFGGTSHAWCSHYEAHVDSDRSCLNEWHAMDSIESRRPPSPDSLRHKPRQRDETERVIRCTLKEIMMSVDLDDVTSKAIRGRLEEDFDMDLAEYKSFIDQEMLTILGQMDAPTEVFDHVYLGSEWNASNLDELRRNGVRHILNVTREIDNFFPGMFVYLNIRVYDDDKTDLLKHWDDTFKFINKARNEGSKVLVHCKMGISRSASVVIAYAMKAYNWTFDKAVGHVKAKRSCIKPNKNFLTQLETYQGMLAAMKNREKLQRSKSETNLKSPKTALKMENKAHSAFVSSSVIRGGACGGRPRSWSPDTKLALEALPPTSVSLEHLAETRHMLMPCANGTYSVSPNQIIRLPEEGAPSVKHIVNEIENATSFDRREFSKRFQRLNSTTEASVAPEALPDAGRPPQASPLRTSTSHKHTHSEVDKIHTWDPGEASRSREDSRHVSESDNIVKSDSGIIDVKLKTSDVFPNYVDRNLDCERSAEEDPPPPSRQSSWSSFDSAVVPDLSRHSSWGSYDTRTARPQTVRQDDAKRPKDRVEERSVRAKEEDRSELQRTSADLGIISEYSGIRRAKVASFRSTGPAAVGISENERKFNETCAILKELERVSRRPSRGASTWSGPLSTSAPADTWLRGGLSRRRPAAASHPDLPRAAASAAATGLVSNLKKEFEARSEGDAAARLLLVRGGRAPGEDLSVKLLVGRYDQPPHNRARSEAHESKRSRPGCEAGAALRHSFCGERPPPPVMAPTVMSMAPPVDYSRVLLPTVVSKAQNKKQLQHGKTHPLTRLNLNRANNRCSNPVYNTM